jgi:hypothetical protein
MQYHIILYEIWGSALKTKIFNLSIAKKSCEGMVKKESTPCEKEPKT